MPSKNSKRNNKSSPSTETTKATKKEVAAPSVKEVAAPVKEPVVAAAATTTESEETDISIFQLMRDRIASQERELRELRVMMKRAEQVYKREQRLAAQRTARAMPRKKRARAAADPTKQRSPSGIAKPTKISAELAKFLSVEPSALMARTEVIKQIASYIKEHKLENAENRREIVPDKALGRLLGATKGDKVTYFNLQRYMKRHFPKMDTAATASS